MVAEPPLSKWAQGTFGARAFLIRQGVAESLSLAMENAQDAQMAAQTDHLHPFGFTLMSRKFEALARTFEDMGDVQVIKPTGSQHELVVLGGNLLFPFRYARDRPVSVMNARIGDGRTSGLVQALFDRFGPEPTAEQLALYDHAPDTTGSASIAQVVAHLPEDIKLVLIGYSCNAQAGLLEAWWGEAELLDRMGNLRWHHCEAIPLTKTGSTGARLSGPGMDTAGTTDAPKFDQGTMPTPSLNPRTPIERRNGDNFPPASEATPPMPDAADDEGR